MNIQDSELADARKGAIYFLGNLEFSRSHGLSASLISNFVGDTTAVSDLKTVVGKLLPPAAVKVVEPVDKFRTLIESFFRSLEDYLKKIFGDALHGVEWISEFVSWGVSTFAGSLASAIPGWGYVQSAGDMYSGVKKAVSNAIDLIKMLWSGYGVKLLAGIPTEISSALCRHSTAGIAAGVKDVGIASVSIGLEAAGDSVGGAGSIVSVVTGILQRIVNLVDWCIQNFRLKRVLADAREDWATRYMMNKPDELNKWFSRNVILTPVVAALVLASGFVGHPYRFLALIDPKSGAVKVSQKEFDKGVKYIEQLRDISDSYLRNYSGVYQLDFSSKDKVIQGRLDKVFV